MRLGLIATSSLAHKAVSGDTERDVVATRFGDVPVELGTLGDDEVVIVSRAGARHPLEPGRINYRANILALRALGVGTVLSTCVVGSLSAAIPPGAVVAVQQFLDFTRHRAPTLFDEYGFGFTDMTDPYCPRVRDSVNRAGHVVKEPVRDGVCYVGVDGPRYETAAEVRMFGLLGGNVVGHTGVTEAIMAREAGMCHGCVALVTNYAAGLESGIVSNEEVTRTRQHHADRLEHVAAEALRLLPQKTTATCDCAAAPGVRQLPPWNDAVGAPVAERSRSDQ